MRSSVSARRSGRNLLLAGSLLLAPAARRPWLAWLAPMLSVAMFSAAVWQMHQLDLHRLAAVLPGAGGFWLAIGAAYLIQPVSEWVIYRRLWELPLGGIAPLMRKYVSNEILLGYSGELYFYAWARERLRFAGAPFAAVKDVTVLSAQAGNIATLVLLMFAWPQLDLLQLDVTERNVILSCVLATALSLPVFLLRHKLFALPAPELRRIMTIHLIRIFAVLLLSALAWHAAMPRVGLAMWLMLAAIRQLLSRLPLLPNKDLMFAALVVFLLGAGSPAADMIALSATVILTLHLLFGVALASGELLFRESRD